MVRRTSIMKKIGIIGAGSWGTALATVVADKGHTGKDLGHRCRYICRVNGRDTERTSDYLPGVHFRRKYTASLRHLRKMHLRDADVVLFSAPAQHFRSALEARTAVHKRRCSDHQCCKGHRAEEFEADV